MTETNKADGLALRHAAETDSEGLRDEQNSKIRWAVSNLSLND